MSPWREQNEWDNQVLEWVGADAVLCGVGKFSEDVRVYRRAERAFKIRRFTPASVFNRPNSLLDEYLVLRWLERRAPGETWFPRAVGYRRDGEWEMFEMTWMRAPAARDPVMDASAEPLIQVWRLARLAWRLNRLGISHGDLKPDNAGLNDEGRWVVLDFDQALAGPPLRCVLRDFFGIPLPYRAAMFTVWDRATHAGGLRPFFRVLDSLRARLSGRGKREADGPGSHFARCEASGGALLLRIAQAWRLAAEAGANSPGAGVAYYAWDVGGVHFPGERSWSIRWQLIRREIDFRGKRLVELGCNLGLLSLHAVEAGASEATGVDHSAGVVDAAALLGSALGSKARFLRVDLDADVDWERRVGTGDVITLLSLTHWLKDKERVWRFAAGFSEVLFEGHEPVEEVKRRLLALGLDDVREIGVSERNRPLLHARRSQR